MKYLIAVMTIVFLLGCSITKKSRKIEQRENTRFLLIEKRSDYILLPLNIKSTDTCKKGLLFTKRTKKFINYSDFVIHKDTCQSFIIKSIKNINPNKIITISSMLDSIVNRNYGALLNHDFYLIDARVTPIQVSKVVYKMPMADRGHPDEPDQLITPKEWPVKTKG